MRLVFSGDDADIALHISRARFSKATATAAQDRLRTEVWRLYGRKMTGALLRAVARTMDDASVTRLADALEGLSVADATDVFRWDVVGAPGLRDDVESILSDALDSAGSTEADRWNVDSGFAITGSDIVSWLGDESDAVIRFATDAQAEALRIGIRSAIDLRLSPQETAVILLESDAVGLDPRGVNAMFNFLRRQIEAGVPASTADQRAIEYGQRLVASRAEMIARTELSRAATRGQLEAFSQIMGEGLAPMTALKEWVVNGDPCPECEDVDGEQVGVDEVFSNGEDGPPLHPNCQCTLDLVDAAAA